MFLFDQKEGSFVVAVGGARGVGKTTTLRSLAQMDNRIRIINLAGELNNFSVSEHGQNFFDLSTAVKDLLREKYATRLIENLRLEQGFVALDLHFTDHREGERKIIQPESLLARINMFVCLDGNSRTIRNRGLGDSSKSRIDDLFLIEKDRHLEIRAARLLAKKYDKDFIYFWTEGQGANDVAVELFNRIGVNLLEKGEGKIKNERES